MMHTPQSDHAPTQLSAPFSLHNSIMLRTYFFCATIISSLSVALQAVSAHLPNEAFNGLHGREVVHTGANIGLWHGIALCALITSAPYLHPVRARLAYSGMIVGTLFFSVSVTLYGLNITNKAALAPAGGFLLIISWLIAGSAIFQRRYSSKRD